MTVWSAACSGRCRPAFTLLEVLGFMTAIAMALALLLVVLGGALKLEAASAGVLKRLGSQRILADQFRSDVNRTVEAPQHWKDNEAGTTCLILRQGKDRHTVYRFDAGRLVRYEHNGEQVQQREIALGGGQWAVEFVRPEKGGQLFTVRLSSVRKGASPEPAGEISAALGGDLQ
jgi:hypothetical protein